MRALRAWGRRLAGVFVRRRWESDLDEELASHLQLHIDDNLRAGMPPDEARRAALVALGGMAQTRERVGDRRGLPWLEAAARDVRYASRTLRRSPGFTAVAALTLALGIGANAAFFSLVDAILLQSLPVRHPRELVTLAARDPRGGDNSSFSYPMYRDLRDRGAAFAGVIARGGAQINLSYRGANERVDAELVSGNYYDVLGVRPFIGRVLTPADDRTPGGHPVAVLSYAFWQRRFGGDPAIVGQTVLLNEHPITVVGVAARGFYGLDLSRSFDVHVPLAETPVFNPVPANRLENRRWQWLTLMARLGPGVTVAQASASAGALYRQIRESDAEALPPRVGAAERARFLETALELGPGFQGRQGLQRELRLPLLLLFGATLVVLLILGANLANLLLARAAARAPEMAMRLALGASRARLVQQGLVESVLLSLGGAALGVVVAVGVRQALVAFMSAPVRDNLDAPLDWTVLAFLLGVGVAFGVLAGLVPALRASRLDAAPTLQRETRSTTGGGLARLRGGLIAAQVALSVPLLVGAGLFLRSLANVRGIDIGFVPAHVLVASVNPSANGYSTERARAFYGRLLDEVRALPGVRAAALATDSPISGGWDQMQVVVDGYRPREGENMSPNAASVSPGYFATLGIPLAAGRDFTERDTFGAPKVAIVNQAMARYFFGDADPIGRRIGTEETPDTEIVGVVADAKYVNLRETVRRHFYVPVAQEPRLFDLTLHVRAEGDPGAAASLVRAAVERLDPHLPVYRVTTLAAQIDRSLVEDRLLSWLSTAFSLLATALAAIGLYGVVAFSVARRTRDIGVRVALGATRADILFVVMRGTLGWVAGGLVAGIGAAAAVSRLVASQLYGIAPTDPVSFFAAGILLIASVALAAYLPASRAARVDPVTALRHE